MTEQGCSLFKEEDITPWKAEWQNMPDYSIEDLSPEFQLIVNFTCAGDVEEFAAIIGQSVKAAKGRQLPSIWFPEQEIGRMSNKRYIDL
jgi:hypothetical protein